MEGHGDHDGSAARASLRGARAPGGGGRTPEVGVLLSRLLQVRVSPARRVRARAGAGHDALARAPQHSVSGFSASEPQSPQAVRAILSNMPIYRRWTAFAVALVAPLVVSAGRLPRKPTLASVPVTLNNLSPLPDTRADSDATAQLGHEARARLGYCGYPVATDTTMPAAAVGHAPSYLFEHPDVAAEWG